MITILIPYHTHTKTIDFLKRQLTYYHNHSFPMKVIIALSGEDNIKDDVIEFLKGMNDPRFSFLSSNEKEVRNVRSFINKIYEALKISITPYVVINGADDVIIPEALEHGTKVLANDHSISGVKGHTVYFNCDSGNIFFSEDLEITNNCPLERLKLAIQDRDSIFYIIRRTEELSRDYKNILELSTNSDIVANSFYHIEHFKALGIAALGKVCVFNTPWRIQSSHANNHTSHTPASFIRIQAGILDRKNYEKFKSNYENMKKLSYFNYKFLWVCHQIIGISITFKQIVYNYLHKKCSLTDFMHLLMYFFSNKIYVFLRRLLPKKWSERPKFHGSKTDFIKLKQYEDLRKHYFSEYDIKLIES